MALKSMYPDEVAYPLLLRSSSQLLDNETGKKIHGHVLKLGFDLSETVRCAFDDGNDRQLFEKMTAKGSVYWSSLIFEACLDGDLEKSFHIFNRMRMERMELEPVTVINLLRATVDLGLLKVGRCIHSLIVVSSLCEDMAVSTALLTMYSKLRSVEDARLLFDRMPERDSVVWNLMISAYSRNGYPKDSLDLLMRMVRSGVRTDLFTAIPAISSVAELKSLEWGKQIHAHAIRNGSDYQVSVHNSLIDMYFACNGLEHAQKIFYSLTNKTLVSWSAMIKGYVKHEQFYNALSLFAEMKLAGFRIDNVTVINILPACVNIGALKQVKDLHGYSIKCALNSLLSVNTAFLVSYAKCGCIEMARKLFDETEVDSKDTITWNSMIGAYSKHGDWFNCLELYNQMKQSMIKPDHVTFLALLTVCVNLGFLEEGRQFFKEMKETYHCEPNQEHYACMVDLLGRAGHVNEASELINKMPFKPDARVWGPLLSACKMHSETRLAELAAEKLITMEPKNAGNYVLLSNIYAASGKWDEVAKMRIFLRDRGLKKIPGCSWLEINGQVHEFHVADRSHPKANYIYAILENLEFEIKEYEEKGSNYPSYKPICSWRYFQL